MEVGGRPTGALAYNVDQNLSAFGMHSCIYIEIFYITELSAARNYTAITKNCFTMDILHVQVHCKLWGGGPNYAVPSLSQTVSVALTGSFHIQV